MYGNCFITNKMEDLQMQMNQSYILAFVDEEDAEAFKFTGLLPVGVLLPPFEALSAEVDMNQQYADNIYIQYLSDINRRHVFSIILKALHDGKNICFYVPANNDMNVRFMSTFIAYMQTFNGIIVADNIGFGLPNVPSVSMDPMYESYRLNIMFAEDLIDLNQYSIEYPPNMYPSAEIANKIVSMYNYTMPLDEAVKFAYGVMCNIKNSANSNMTNVFVRSMEAGNNPGGE